MYSYPFSGTLPIQSPEMLSISAGNPHSSAGNPHSEAGKGDQAYLDKYE
jgi:hypothetical protein